VAKRQTQET